MYNFYEEESTMIKRMSLDVLKRYIVSIKKEVMKLNRKFKEESTVDNFIREQEMLDLYLLARKRIDELEARK